MGNKGWKGLIFSSGPETSWEAKDLRLQDEGHFWPITPFMKMVGLDQESVLLFLKKGV